MRPPSAPFFDELGPARTLRLEAIGTDTAAWYIEAIAAAVPAAAVCIDPSTSWRLPTAPLTRSAERSGTACGARPAMRDR